MRRTTAHRSVIEDFMVARGTRTERSARTLRLFGSLALVMIGGPVSVAVAGPAGVVPPLLLTAAAIARYEVPVSRVRRRIRDDRLCLRCACSLTRAAVDGDGDGTCPECGNAFNVAAYEA